MSVKTAVRAAVLSPGKALPLRGVVPAGRCVHFLHVHDTIRRNIALSDKERRHEDGKSSDLLDAGVDGEPRR